MTTLTTMFTGTTIPTITSINFSTGGSPAADSPGFPNFLSQTFHPPTIPSHTGIKQRDRPMRIFRLKASALLEPYNTAAAFLS